MPYCWCRNTVLAVYPKLDWLLKGYRERSQSVDLLEIRTTRSYPIDEWSLEEGPAAWISSYRSDYIRKHLSKALGVYSLFSIEAPDFRKRSAACYLLRQRILALVSCNHPTPPEAREEDQGITIERAVSRVIQPDDRKVAGALGRTALYPVQMLRGPVKETAEILRILQRSSRVTPERYSRAIPRGPGLRMSEKYGFLRGQKLPFTSMESPSSEEGFEQEQPGD